MLKFFWPVFVCLLRFALSLRYKVTVIGLEKLSKKKLSNKDGILFLPNHPAHTDPVLNFLFLWPKFRIRPLVVEYVYRMRFIQPILKATKALAVPNFETGVNEYKIKKAEQALEEIKEGLRKGENFIVYPSGRLKGEGKEIIAGASGTFEIVKKVEGENVVLIRTTGLWGSMFSKAFSEKTPNVATMIKKGIKTILRNLIFFAPRRKITIEVEPNPEGFPFDPSSRAELNRYLENWYNRYRDEKGNIVEEEPMQLVSYSFWKRDIPEVFERKKEKSVFQDDIAPAVKEKVYAQIRKILNRPDLEIKPEMSLLFDLSMDSLELAEFLSFIVQEFGIRNLTPEDLDSVRSVLEILSGKKKPKPRIDPSSAFSWPPQKKRPSPYLPLGKTIPEAFLRICLRMRGNFAVGDDNVGVLSYRQCKRAVLVLAEEFRRIKEEKVAVLLPASVGAYLTIFALQMAGKIPVILNWTLGARYLDDMMRISGAKRVLSSWKFLDRLSNIQFGSILDRILLLEDFKMKISLRAKLKGLFLSLFGVLLPLKAFSVQNLDENSPCVILFTSGTESSPKGVPLSHKNLLSNIRSAMQCIAFFPTDVMYASPPPFHSFGLNVCGFFPILSGVRTAFYPDPTDSYGLAEGIMRWKGTFFASPPSFLQGLFQAAKKEQLETLRGYVSGAEKVPKELFSKAAKISPNARIFEGYGVSEGSPIVSQNRPNVPTKGVGRLLPDIEMITIHPETQASLAEGEDGEVCLRGPNFFKGYLGEEKDPFIEIDGKKWYRTGDLGYLEKERTLVLSGRLKRFTKIGAEMISLGAIEEAIAQSLQRMGKISPDSKSIALIANEEELGRPKLILFAITPLDLSEVNNILKQEGFSNLVKITEVRKIDVVPLIGAGKTDYRKLMDLC